MDKSTEQLLLEQQINFLKNLETLLSGFTHDINNNLAVMAGQSSIMKTLVEMGKSSEEKTLKSSEKVLNASEKMTQKIERLRAFYKPAAIDNTKTNIMTAFNTMYMLSIPKIDRNGLMVTKGLLFNEQQEDLYAKGNPSLFNILLWNIHYFYLDQLEADNKQQLFMSTDIKDQSIEITYKLEPNLLGVDVNNCSELIIARLAAKQLDCKLKIDTDGKETKLFIALI